MCAGGSQTWFGKTGKIPDQVDKSRGWFGKTGEIPNQVDKSRGWFGKTGEIPNQGGNLGTESTSFRDGLQLEPT